LQLSTGGGSGSSVDDAAGRAPAALSIPPAIAIATRTTIEH